MSKSPWNFGASIPISTLSDEELRTAMKEWAEGNDHLERLLWSCYENGIETIGSCCHSAYLQINLDTSDKNNLRKLFAATSKCEFTDILLTFAGNPYSGPDWWKPNISFGIMGAKEEQVNTFFDKLCYSLEGNMETCENCKGFTSFVELYEFFKDKECDIAFRIVIRDSSYKFSITCLDNTEYFSELLSSSLLTKEEETDEKPLAFVFKSSDYDEFAAVVDEISKFIISNCTISAPEELKDDMRFSAKALFMRRKFGTDISGIKQMNKWLNENKPAPFFRDVNY